MDSSFVLTFKKKLDSLSCPITKDVEESWISDLIYTSVRQRLCLIEWLITKFDSSYSEILGDKDHLQGDEDNMRVERILAIVSSLGLCSPSDTDLVKGIASRNDQEGFMSLLVDLACSYSDSNGINWERTSKDCLIMDRLVTQEPLSLIHDRPLELVPPDIKKHLGNDQASQKSRSSASSSITSKSNSPSVPLDHLPLTYEADMETLRSELNDLKEKLEKCQNVQPQISCPASFDPDSLNTLFSQLDKSATSFIQWSGGIETSQIRKNAERIDFGSMFSVLSPLADRLNLFVSSLAALRKNVDAMTSMGEKVLHNNEGQIKEVLDALIEHHETIVESKVDPGLGMEDIPSSS